MHHHPSPAASGPAFTAHPDAGRTVAQDADLLAARRAQLLAMLDQAEALGVRSYAGTITYWRRKVRGACHVGSLGPNGIAPGVAACVRQCRDAAERAAQAMEIAA